MKHFPILAAALLAGACATAPRTTLSGLDPEAFHATVDGRETGLYVLTNKAGVEACITNFGGRLVSLMVPDRDGTMRDVVLGFDNIDDYRNVPSDFGASIGRYANRIGQGRFELDGKVYDLPKNNYGHCLHGGPEGWQYKVYEAHRVDDRTLELTLHSPDGDSGFPGAVGSAAAGRRYQCGKRLPRLRTLPDGTGADAAQFLGGADPLRRDLGRFSGDPRGRHAPTHVRRRRR